MRFVLAFAASLVCFLPALHAADQADELAGVWRMISTNGQRHEYADDLDRATLLTFNPDDNTWRLQSRNDSEGLDLSGSYTPDATQTPKLLDAVINGDGGATPVYGIYKVEGETLTIHFRQDGQRPGDFESPPESSSTVVLRKHVTQ